jgi:hypothetical protein
MLRLPILAAFAIAILSLVIAIWLDNKFVAPHASTTTTALPTESERQEMGRQMMQKAMTQKLKPGTQAPPLTLRRADGSGQVELKELQGQKPVILIFGSFTCDCFYNEVAQLDQVREQFRDRADFYFVYISEAHADQEVTVKLDQGPAKMSFPVTESVAERMKRAQLLERSTGMQIPAFVALNEDLLEHTYAPWPTRFMVIDRNHRIVFNSGLERMEKDGIAHIKVNTLGFKRFLSEFLPPAGG